MKTLSITLFSTAVLTMCGLLILSQQSLAATKAKLTDVESKFIMEAAETSHAEMKIAELAETKADKADVKAFAKALVADHMRMNKELKKLAAAQGVMLSKEMSPVHAATMQKLEKASGAEFDKDFLAAVADSLHNHISNYEEASKDHQDGALKAFVDKEVPTLKTHHVTAKALMAK